MREDPGIFHVQPEYCTCDDDDPTDPKTGAVTLNPMDGDNRELEYYRQVEDLFSSLRGVPHILSPRDFQLLRSWWRDEVPLAAVSAGLTEIFARQRERDDADPVTSLSYCRHAVKRHAKRLAAMQVGSNDEPNSGSPLPVDLHRTVDLLASTAERLRERRPAVADVVARVATQVDLAGKDLPAEAIDEHLFELEAAMLHDCREALEEDERRIIDERVDRAVDASSASEEARRRSIRALRDREIRLLLDLPRLEIGG